LHGPAPELTQSAEGFPRSPGQRGAVSYPAGSPWQLFQVFGFDRSSSMSTVRLCLGRVFLALCSFAAPALAAEDGANQACGALDLEVRRFEVPPVQYQAFCATVPDDCRLTGPSQIAWTPETASLLEEVNRNVNAEIVFVPDPDHWGAEELWCYPEDGKGDCEDFALEKRRRLVALGLPSASLTMAIAIHAREYFGHAVLLAETSAGTFVLDNLGDALLCWDETPYIWERRERPDGLWVRFVQEW
jgi:predicted transglutaminase-like cysteine proteinase